MLRLSFTNVKLNQEYAVADFFSSLLDRAFERAPVLQWRRPSRFEPVMGTRSMPDDGLRESTDPSQEDRAPVRTAQNRQDADAAFVSARRAPAAPENGRHNAANAQDGNAGSALSVHATPSAAPLDIRRDDRPMPQRRHASEPASPEPIGLLHKPFAPTASITPTAKVVIERGIEKESVQVHVAESADAGGERRGVTPNLNPNPNRLRRPEATSAQIRPVLVPPKQLRQPAKANAGKHESKHDAAAPPHKSARTAPAAPTLNAQARRPPLPVMQAQRAHTPQGPPPIQVTIGRIEIRANADASAAPPRNTRPAAPRLSLEDYLRSRSGGGK
jgi:hypothetical protein